MLYFKSIQEAEDVFKALSTPMRMRIMELIYEDDNLSMNDLAERSGLTNSAISMHVSKLVDAGLVQIKTTSGRRGTMKIVRPRYDRLMIDLAPQKAVNQCYIDDIRIGHYSAYQITPTCGIATPQKIIGDFDNPKTFSYPDRFDAGVLWFGSGYIEYNLPNHLQPGQTVREMQISFEASSECPDTNVDYPSDIHFYLNGISLGTWISPGDFGDRRGFLSPVWWSERLNQYGLLKTLIINNEGCFIDGTSQISNTTVADLNLDYNSIINFRFEVPRYTANCGGLTLFGEDFGDYAQAIRLKLFYNVNE